MTHQVPDYELTPAARYRKRKKERIESPAHSQRFRLIDGTWQETAGHGFCECGDGPFSDEEWAQHKGERVVEVGCTACGGKGYLNEIRDKIVRAALGATE